MTASSPLVFAGVTKTYRPARKGDGLNSVYALRDLDLVLDEGTSLGVVGPNGAGKTTLLRLAMGLSAPDTGRITRRERTVGVIELGIGLHPELTGRENLAFAGSLVGLTGRALRRVSDEIVDFSGLGPHIDRVVKHYSSGMQARLGFAIATHSHAELLLLDEVLAVGDQEFRLRCQDRLRSLVAEGTSMVVVTHDLWMMSSLCQRALFLERGFWSMTASHLK